MNHWLILPILLPAIVAALLALAVRNDIVLARTFSLGTMVCLVVLGMIQLGASCDGSIRTYALGNWPAPFGIVLVLDRLSALMLLLTSVLGLGVLLYAINGCDLQGAHFHPLFLFQLTGLNGAFLTGDLFNLFVFFEVLLIASYGLMVHGGGARRTRAGIQYVVVNLVGSSIFLLALALIYGVTGTLNMADFARRVASVPPAEQAILAAGTMLLLVVFGIKSAVVPLHFWLPGTYANAAGPVVALFAIMTKVGVYAIIRVFLLAYSDPSAQQAFAAADWLLPGAIVTLVLGAIGVLAASRISQQASFLALASMGTILIAVSIFTPSGIAAALYYLLHSTLAVAALFLLIDAIQARRGAFGDSLVLAPRFEHAGVLAATFFIIVVAVIGLPPLSGFVGKLLILDAVSNSAYWVLLWTVILLTSLLMLIAFALSGSLVFWKSGQVADRLEISEMPPITMPMVAIGSILAVLVLLTGFSGLVTIFLDQTAAQLFAPDQYIEAVLGETLDTLTVLELELHP
ncbi:monovalent cation/H+ antiporter subunit D [Planctomycetaceae bacterium SH139]